MYNAEMAKMFCLQVCQLLPNKRRHHLVYNEDKTSKLCLFQKNTTIVIDFSLLMDLHLHIIFIFVCGINVSYIGS